MRRYLKLFSLFLLLNSTITSAPSLSVEAYPIPRSGFCPSGYHASGNYCVPNDIRSGAAVEREGFCPSGYHASGSYCVANSASSGKAIFRNGFCPNGYHSSGNYCLQNR